MKKIIFSLLILPLIFYLGSFFISQKAHAASYNINIGTVVDNGNRNFNTTNTDHCYDGKFTVTITDASGTRTLSKDSQSNCASSFLNTSVTLRANDPDLYELGEDYFRITITAPNKDLNFIYIYNFSSSETKRDNSKTANITAGHKQIVFGIKPYCNENLSTNCLKCSSNSQCSSDSTFKYCAPTTDKCSDLTTYKESLCNANNYCGTFTVGGTSLACGGCGTGKTCRTDVHTCSTVIPNCTAGAQLTTCKAKNTLPKPDGGTCGPGSGTQTKTLTTRPNYSDCKEVTTTQDCTAPEAQVCRSGNCVSGECTAASDPNTRTLSFSGYVFIDNGSGGGTAGNGKKDGGEAIYTNPYTVQAAGNASTKNGNNYTVTTKTSSNNVTVKLLVPAGYASTKLNYLIPSESITNNPTVNGANVDLRASGSVNFGIKAEPVNPDQTRDLIVSAFTFPGGVDTGTSDPIVKIKNQGNTQITGDFNVKVVNRDGGASKIWTVTQAVSPGEVIDLSSRFVNMPRPAAGTHTANAFVDSAGNISETNEGNNFKTDSYTTTKPDSNPTTKPPTNPPSPTCDKNPPTLEITPNNRNGSPGDEKEYDVKVINNDKGASCNPVNFVLSKEHLPSTNWTGSFADNTLSNIEKNGGFKSTKFRIKSPSGATSGPKTITIGLRRDSQTTAQIQVNTLYTVTENTPNSPTPKPDTCEKNPPKISFVSNSITANPGESAMYKLIIEGMDTGDCAPRKFDIKATAPNDNWRIILAKLSVDVSPGSKSIIDMAVSSPTDILPGENTIKVDLINSNNDVAASGNVKYIVPGDGCKVANPDLSITPQTKTGKPGETIKFENIVVKNNDSGSCADRKFTLEVVPPNSSWEPGYFGQDFNLTPGEQTILDLQIRSPQNISTGEYNTVLNLLHNGNKASSVVAIYKIGEDGVTPIPGKTYLNFRIGIDGIGTTPRIPIGGNKNPNSISRGLNFKIYNTATNTLSFTGTNITFTYNQNSEKFELLYDLPSVENLPNGSYNIYVDGPGYLTNQYPGSFSITQGQVTDLISNNFYLITGNVNNSDLSENRIDLMDYNLLLSCSVYSQDRSACDADENNEKYTDLDDNGIVNEDDYTLFLKEFANQQGVILPE